MRCIADAPIDEQLRGELRGLFYHKLSRDPFVALHRSTLTKVEFPENCLRQVDWDRFMNNQEYVNTKRKHLAKFFANLWLQHPTETSAQKHIVACAVLTEQEVVIVGPLGVHYLGHAEGSLRKLLSS